jgi:hypothetical protein
MTQSGFRTFRTWWHRRHRRHHQTKVNETNSVTTTTITPTDDETTTRKSMQLLILQEYTRHFFTMLHCMIVHGNVQPPKTLYVRIQQMTARTNIEEQPLQQQQPQVVGLDTAASSMHSTSTSRNGGHSIQGTNLYIHPQRLMPASNYCDNNSGQQSPYGTNPKTTTTPNIFVVVVIKSNNGDIQIAFKVDRIVGTHSVKIIETVLCGRQPPMGQEKKKSAISGLLDAVADEHLHHIFVKIETVTAAPRIANEVSQNLRLVGYTAEPYTIDDTMQHAAAGGNNKMVIATSTLPTTDLFDWTIPCTCPHDTINRDLCQRCVTFLFWEVLLQCR